MQDSRLLLQEKLKRFLPDGTEEIISEWIIEEGVKIKITKSRTSKHGDYSSPALGKGHFITINHDLNKYAFLITLVHEFAHMKAHKKYASFFRLRRIQPHGKEWKSEFQNLMIPFLSKNIFPLEIHFSLAKYMQNPSATDCSDIHLQRALRQHNNPSENFTLLENIPDNSVFSLNSGKIFKKIKKMRKNYLCLEMNSKRKYSVSPIAEVNVIQNAF